MVLVTVRVLPFLFLTVVLICAVTLLVSTLDGAAVIAPAEVRARGASGPPGRAQALARLAPPAPARFQIGVAGFSTPDHSKPPIAAAAHNSASANRRGLAIARLPPFGYPRHAAQPAHDGDDCPLTAASCKARKLRVVIFQKGVVEMQRMYRILGNRRRINGQRAVGWAKSCASDSRRLKGAV